MAQDGAGPPSPGKLVDPSRGAGVRYTRGRALLSEGGLGAQGCVERTTGEQSVR